MVKQETGKQESRQVGKWKVDKYVAPGAAAGVAPGAVAGAVAGCWGCCYEEKKRKKDVQERL